MLFRSVGFHGDVEGVGVGLDVGDDCLEGGEVTGVEGGGGGAEGEAQGDEGGGEFHVGGGGGGMLMMMLK